MAVWYHHKLCKGEFIIMRIILASGSPRRKELLAQAGYDFVIEVSDADENIQADSPGTLEEELSHRKAGAVAKQHMAGESGTACHAADYADGAAIKLTGAGAAAVQIPWILLLFCSRGSNQYLLPTAYLYI